MSLTIAFFTNRVEPKVEWFFRSLKREIGSPAKHEVHVILVDFHADEPGRRDRMVSQLQAEGPTLASFLHVTPKPSAWQGKHRKTKVNHFDASGARNTAFALCKTDFIACVDDLSVMLPGWLDQVTHAQTGDYCALGAYKKVLNLGIDRDFNITFEPHPPGVDSRWDRGSDTGVVPAEGSWLFGCSFALPMKYVLRVNGFDELCSGVGMEDVEFGMRLQRVGCRFFYNRNMCTYEDDLLHSSEGNIPFVRESRPTKHGVNADWYIYNGVTKQHKVWTELNDFVLEDLRKSVLKGQAFPLPKTTKDWASGKLLSEL